MNALPSTALAPTGAALATTLATTAMDFSADQRQMIRDTFASGASDAEFAVLLEVAKARKLNPLLRQIHFVKRYDSQRKREVWSTQVSIDGLRAIAERTGRYDGQDEPEYIYDAAGKLACAKVRIYRRDWSRPAVGVAFMAEYQQTTREGVPTRFWSQMPHVMLAKCAEALACRKAFPEDTGGLYVPEEMGERDADRDPAPAVVAEPARPAPAAPQPPTDADRLDGVRVMASMRGTVEELRDLARDVGRAFPAGHPRRDEAVAILTARRAEVEPAREPGQEG